MTNLFGGSERQQIYVYLTFFSCLIGAICSLIVLFLIRKMGLRNSHVLLIQLMSWFQLAYDISQFPTAVNIGNNAALDVFSVINLFSGISSALTSNIIALVAFYVCRYIQVIDVHKRFPGFFIAIILPGLVCIILYIMSCHSPYEYLNKIALAGMYFYIRLVSIIANFVICTATVVHLWFRRSKNLSSRSLSLNTSDKMSLSERAIRTLAFRLIYYPIVQAISRAAVTWYEIKYGFDFDPSNMPTSQYIGMCMFAIFVPSASYGYLAIFLLMQPDAWECLKCTVMCRPYVKKAKNNSDILSVSTAQSSLHRSTGNFNVFDINTNMSECEIDRPTLEEQNTSTASNNENNRKLHDIDEEELLSIAQTGVMKTNSIRISQSITSLGSMSIEIPRVGSDMHSLLSIGTKNSTLTDVSSPNSESTVEV